MDAKIGEGEDMSMVHGLFLVLGLWSMVYGPAMAAEPMAYVAYAEKRNGMARELTARLQGETIFLDKLTGPFPKNLKPNPPWYLKGLPFLQESVLLQLGEDLPPLSLQRKWELQKEEIHLGKRLVQYRVTLALNASQQVIPLNAEETEETNILKPLGVEEIHLAGSETIWVDPEQKKVLTEDLSLAGAVFRDSKKVPLLIEWAYVVGGFE